MRLKTFFTILLVGISVFIASCKKDMFKPVTNMCPLIIETNPPDGATGVPLNKVITVTFNKEMDSASITDLSFLVSGSVVAGIVSYENKVATFTPVDPLLENHTYVGYVKTIVKDYTGNHLQEEFSWTFSTGSVINPLVISTSPINLESDVPLNKTISASFSLPMNAGSIDSSFTLMQGMDRVVGVFSYYDNTAYFIPSSALLPGKNYTAKITTGATSVDGQKLQSDYVWTFTTHSIDAPLIIETNPEHKQIDVALNTKIKVFFDVPMDPTSFTGASFNLKNGITAVSGLISVSDNEADFTPSIPLLPETVYTVYLGSTVKNKVGVSIAKDTIWTFTTGVSTAPTLVSTIPLNNAINVPLNQTITANFSGLLDPLTVTVSTFVVKQGTNIISGAITTVGKVVTFTPSSSLNEGMTYVVSISKGVKDLSGVPLANSYTWKFTAITSPKIVSVDPLDLEQSVQLNKVIHVIFDMPMNPATLTSSNVVLKQGSTVIPCTIVYSGNTMSVAPVNVLLGAQVYTVLVTTGAKNIAGAGLSSDYSWSFTTGNISAPTITSTSPLNNATNVSLNSKVSATFNEQMLGTSISNTTFKLKLGTTAVSGSVYMVGNTAFFEPLVNLISGKTYVATVTKEVKNAAGIKLANDYSWTFSTKKPLGPLAPTLNEVEAFGIIAGTAVSNNAGFSKINNLDVGLYPGVRSSITGFPPAVIVNGAIHASDDLTPVGIAALLLQAKTDLTTAYLFAEAASTPAPATVAGDQGGKTLAPGIYKTTSTLLIQNGDLTLDAQGDVNAVWIFQIASTLTTVGGAGGDIILSGGAQAKNIYWQVGSSATLGGYTKFKGNILALTSITMGVYSVADGRMLARNGAVSMVSTNTINKP